MCLNLCRSLLTQCMRNPGKHTNCPLCHLIQPGVLEKNLLLVILAILKSVYGNYYVYCDTRTCAVLPSDELSPILDLSSCSAVVVLPSAPSSPPRESLPGCLLKREKVHARITQNNTCTSNWMTQATLQIIQLGKARLLAGPHLVLP